MKFMKVKAGKQNFMSSKQFDMTMRGVGGKVEMAGLTAVVGRIVTRKPDFSVCDQVRLKPICSADQTS